MAIAKENPATDDDGVAQEFQAKNELPPHNEGKSQTQAARRDAPVVCPTCGRRVKRQMRGQLYCSARCRDRGRN